MKTKGFEAARRKLRKRAAEIRGTKGKLYQNLSQDMSRSIAKNVNAGGREPKWKKRKRTYAHPILDKTGLMRDTAESTALRLWQVTGTRHVLAIEGPDYGPHHQYGTKKLPVRKYVKPTGREREKMRNRVRTVLNQKKIG